MKNVTTINFHLTILLRNSNDRTFKLKYSGAQEEVETFATEAEICAIDVISTRFIRNYGNL